MGRSVYDEEGHFRNDLSEREIVHKGVKWFIIVVLALLVFSAVIGVGSWALGVGTSDIFGRGEAVKIKNDATNRVQAQAGFHRSFDGIKSLDQRLTDAQVQLDAFNMQHPNVGNGTAFDPQAEQQGNLQRSVTGLQQQCRIAVADYNASTETYTLRDFRDSDLPFKIESTDPIFNGSSANGSAEFSDFDCVATADETGGK